MGLLAPGLQLELAAGVPAQGGDVALAQAGAGQGVEGLERLLVQLHAPGQCPLLERGAVGQREAGQEIAAVSLDRLGVPRYAGVAAGRRVVRVRGALGQQAAERCDIERVIAGGRELHAVAAREQVRSVHLAQQPAQIGQRHAQIAASRVLRRLGPQQAEQGIAAVAVGLLDGQVGQQRQVLARAERHGAAVGANDLR